MKQNKYKSGLFMQLFLIYLFLAVPSVQADWAMPNTPQTGIGDMGNFYLNSSGITFHANNNDFIGLTDKLLTSSSTLSLYLQPSSQSGFELSVQRRFITPIIKTHFNKPDLPTPQGIYADELEVRSAYSYLWGAFKTEISFSMEDYGNLDGDVIQRVIHRIVGSEDDTSRYGKKRTNVYLGGALGAGIMLGDHLLFMLYAHESAIIREAVLRVNLRFVLRSMQLGLQAEAARQYRSAMYQDSDLEKFRKSLGVSFKWGWYQFSFGYVVPYLKYDNYGQYFIDPFILSYEF